MISEFFWSLPELQRFEDCSKESMYRSAPREISVVITDVEGSTMAIEAGKYKLVNLAGASTIVALVNALGSRQFPFQFGGDGVTALVPNEKIEIVKEVLAESKKQIEDDFGLKMRIGVVPLEDLLEAGAAVLVARFPLSSSTHLAFFRGRGLALAEQWVKAGKYQISSASRVSRQDLHAGLSCRWAPIPHENGKILSMIVQPREGAPADFESRLVGEISKILELESPTANPVKAEKMGPEDPSLAAEWESKVQSTEGRWLRRWVAWLTIHLVSWLNNRPFGKPVKAVVDYKASVARHSDYRKFDGVLRLVVDVTPEQDQKLRQMLSDYLRKGLVFFGMHSSETALMTCFVQDMQEQHIHFIDGGDGGLALAAKELKAQIKASS